MGHEPRILAQKEWGDLGDGLRALCVANENMDAVIAIDVGGTLLLDKNGSPFCGGGPFFDVWYADFSAHTCSLCVPTTQT